MVGKSVYIVMNDGYVEEVFDSEEKAKKYMRESYPSDFTPEEIEEDLKENSYRFYYTSEVVS